MYTAEKVEKGITLPSNHEADAALSMFSARCSVHHGIVGKTAPERLRPDTVARVHLNLNLFPSLPSFFPLPIFSSL